MPANPDSACAMRAERRSAPSGPSNVRRLFDRPTMLELLVGQLGVSLSETRDRVDLCRGADLARSEHIHCLVEQRRVILQPHRAQRRADNVRVFARPVLPPPEEPSICRWVSKSHKTMTSRSQVGTS